MENNNTTLFALDQTNCNNNNINNNSNNNYINDNNVIINSSNNVINNFNFHNDYMLHSNNDVDFKDNYGQITFDNALIEDVDDYLVDPMFLLCDEIMEDPIMGDIFSDLTSSSVQVNNINNNDNNNNNNNDNNSNNDNRINDDAVIIVHNNGDNNRRKQEDVLHDSLSFDDSCSSCQVLREITHINGNRHTIKLELHGVIGIISHGILVNYLRHNNDVAPKVQGSQMIDFSGMNYNMVKNYIKKYLEEQRQKGYIMLQEHISPFYEALCIGYNWSSVCPNLNTSNDLQMSTILVAEPIVQENHEGPSSRQVVGDETRMSHHQDVPHQQEMHERLIFYEQKPNTIRTDLSIQRERTKSMKIEDFAKYFDLPVKCAAKKLYLCDTVVKKKLRSFGVPRWPYRKVKSMKRRMETLMNDLRAENVELRTSAMNEIRRIQHQLNEILRGNINVIRDVLI